MLAHPQITMRKKEREKKIKDSIAGMREKEERMKQRERYRIEMWGYKKEIGYREDIENGNVRLTKG